MHVYEVQVERLGKDLPWTTTVTADSPEIAAERAERREALLNEGAIGHVALYFARLVREAIDGQFIGRSWAA